MIITILDEKLNNYNYNSKGSEAENTIDNEMMARILQLLYQIYLGHFFVLAIGQKQTNHYALPCEAVS